MNNTTIIVIDELEKAEEVWKLLSPSSSVFDLLELRKCFYLPCAYPIRFYTVLEHDIPVAVLPLQLNTERGVLEFFGGEYMEGNKVLSKSSYSYTRQLLESVKEKMELDDMSEYEDKALLAYQEDKYVLPLKYADYKAYVDDIFEGKHRKNILREMRILEEQGISVVTDRPEDIELLFSYNVENFGAESYFFEDKHKECFRNIFKSSLQVRILSFRIQDKTQAVSLSLLHNGVYTFLNSGSNKRDVANIGKYVIIKNVDRAIQENAHTFDACVEELGWKKRFGLTAIPQYKYYR